MDRWHVHNQQVLHVGSAEFPSRKAFSEIRRRLQLVRRYTPAQRNGANVRKSALLLGVDSDMVAVNVVGWILFDRGIELESDALLQFVEKAIRGPSLT